MSHKNHTTPIPDATDSDRHLRAVSDAPGTQNAPTTEDKVRAALTANPASTTAALAMAAGVGRSTAAKILARWGARRHRDPDRRRRPAQSRHVGARPVGP